MRRIVEPGCKGDVCELTACASGPLRVRATFSPDQGGQPEIPASRRSVSGPEGHRPLQSL